MRKYWEMLKSQIKLDFAYSLWFWAGMFSTIMGLIVVFAFWNAVYKNQTGNLGGMDLGTMLTYTVIAMLLGNYVSGVGNQLSANIRDGSVAIELMRPYDLMFKLMALDLGGKVSGTIRNTIPILILAYVFLGIHFPHSAVGFGLFVLSALIGILIGTQFDFIVGILSFWTINAWGLRVLRNAILMFFTGQLIPISLFPNWLQTASAYLPFQSMVYVPVSIYTGKLAGTQALESIVFQLLWLVGIFAVVRCVWAVAIRKVIIFGG